MAETIPASQRPDGTWRKERRVKAGYVPPDEVEKYESKMVKFMNDKPRLPPGYQPPPAAANDEKKCMSKNQRKNERKKQKRKEKSEGGGDVTDDIADDLNNVKITDKVATTTTSMTSDVDLAKKRKGLLKKLKQIEQLEERLAKGETLEKEQLEKISKKDEIEEELELLPDDVVQ